MLRNRNLLLLALATALLTSVSLQADSNDWPQWRGPERAGISAETGLLKQWPEVGPKLVWKATNLGGGYSTPSVSNGRIYLMSDRSNEEYLVALDATDGKLVWTTKIGRVGPNLTPFPGTRSTPTVDGDAIYALASDGDLACVAAADGQMRWQKHLKKDFNGVQGDWAYAESPLIDGDILVCTPGGTEATLVGLNKKSGEVVWKSAIPAGSDPRTSRSAGFASAVITESAGIKQYVQFLGRGVVGVEAKNGKLLWQYDMPGSMNIVTPVIHDNCVFVAHAARGPQESALVKLASNGQSVTASEGFRSTRDLNNHHGGVVRIGEYLYGTNETQLACVEFKTGKTKWQNRSVGKGSITAADGHLYVRGETGPIALVEVSTDRYIEKSKFSPPDRQSSNKCWPHPVIANGRLYLRDANILLCYDIKAN